MMILGWGWGWGVVCNLLAWAQLQRRGGGRGGSLPASRRRRHTRSCRRGRRSWARGWWACRAPGVRPRPPRPPAPPGPARRAPPAPCLAPAPARPLSRRRRRLEAARSLARPPARTEGSHSQPASQPAAEPGGGGGGGEGEGEPSPAQPPPGKGGEDERAAIFNPIAAGKAQRPHPAERNPDSTPGEGGTPHMLRDPLLGGRTPPPRTKEGDDAEGGKRL